MNDARYDRIFGNASAFYFKTVVDLCFFVSVSSENETGYYAKPERSQMRLFGIITLQ